MRIEMTTKKQHYVIIFLAGKCWTQIPYIVIPILKLRNWGIGSHRAYSVEQEFEPTPPACKNCTKQTPGNRAKIHGLKAVCMFRGYYICSFVSGQLSVSLEKAYLLNACMYIFEFNQKHSYVTAVNWSCITTWFHIHHLFCKLKGNGAIQYKWMEVLYTIMLFWDKINFITIILIHYMSPFQHKWTPEAYLPDTLKVTVMMMTCQMWP